MTKTKSGRAALAAERLARVHSAEPGAARQQAIQSWLGIATGGEVRRHWRTWFGPFPSFARHAA